MYLRIRLWPSSVKNPRLRNCIFRFPEISGSGLWTLQFCKVPESKPELNSGFVPGKRFQHFQLSRPGSGLGPGLYPARKRERERERERERALPEAREVRVGRLGFCSCRSQFCDFFFVGALKPDFFQNRENSKIKMRNLLPWLLIR